ncbi:SAP domain protein, partial [Cooperia oncophora]
WTVRSSDFHPATSVQLKVKDLQKELSKRRLSSLGRKAELVARLTEFFA